MSCRLAGGNIKPNRLLYCCSTRTRSKLPVYTETLHRFPSFFRTNVINKIATHRQGIIKRGFKGFNDNVDNNGNDAVDGINNIL